MPSFNQDKTSKMSKHFRLTAITFPPFIFINFEKNSCKGITCDLMKYVSTSLNFTYQYVPYDSPVSFPLENGSWTGLVGLIQRGVCFSFECINLIISILAS